MKGIRAGRTGSMVIVSLAALSALALAACGGMDTNAEDASPAAAVTEPAAPPAVDAEQAAMNGPAAADAAAMPTAITVVARDNVFSVQTIKAAANTEITVTLNNEGVLPHNIAFLTR